MLTPFDAQAKWTEGGFKDAGKVGGRGKVISVVPKYLIIEWLYIRDDSVRYHRDHIYMHTHMDTPVISI